MKFITSTHLKQWAGSKDCQQMLPELIKKLINASVSKLDRLTFPSGDATFLPGWDGIVSCDEQIDLVPAGVSLWECGANDAVKSKIDSDYEKRSKDSLGYDKANSTFVFVTPRLWEDSDEWLKSHQEEWKNIVIYTAVELEDWIEKHPSVGMWLAKKLRILSSTDDKLPETYWEKWASGKDYVLPYEIVLAGREEASKQVEDACLESQSMVIQALTQSEGIAFAIASIMSCNNAEMLKDRLVVVTEKNAYDDLVEHYDNLILLTTVTDGMNYTIKRGHAVIVASTPADQINGAVPLLRIEKEGFVRALVKIGFNKAKAEVIAKDTARDITVFRRREGIIKVKPKWVESLNDLWPAFIVGKWMDNVDGDRAVLESLSGLKYEQFELKLKGHLFEEETPLIQIRNMWRICSPYESIGYLQNWLTPTQLNAFKETCLNLIQDDDSSAIEKLNSDSLFPIQSKQKYSYIIKEGVFQNLCLMSVTDNSNDGKLRYWVEDTLREMLKNWDLSRFLSNRHHFTALAEASPNCFLNFMENLPKGILDEVFTPRNMKYSLSGWGIFYTEILFALEMLAWDVEYLNRVTALLLRYMEYKNDSNYVNKPENSLFNIYSVFMPQTYATFEERKAILTAYSSQYKSAIYEICKKNCESLTRGTFDFNHYYRWRLFGELRETKFINQVAIEQLRDVVTMMLKCCNYSPETIVELVNVSAQVSMGSVRELILDTIHQHLSELDDKQIVSDGLRKTITHHSLYPDASWSLKEVDLKRYRDMLEEIEPKDLMSKSAWLFENYFVTLPGRKERDFEKEQKELLAVRQKTLQEIVDFYGQDGIWRFAKMVKCPECMANVLVSICHDQLTADICQKYKSKEITEGFTKSYFCALCYENVANYLELAKRIVDSDKDMVIVLYAPGYVDGLSKIASDYGEKINRHYWESISAGCNVGNLKKVVQGLLGVNRFSEAIELMCLANESLQMNDLEVANVLYSYLTKGSQMKSQMDLHYIATLLKRLDKSEDSEVIRILVFVEFLWFKALEYEMDMSKTRFVKELSHNPELMMQLVELTQISNDEIDEQFQGVAAKNKKLMKDCALRILIYGRIPVSFIDDNGKLNESFMFQYIEQLKKMSEERKGIGAVDWVIGDILGDIPRDDDYPSNSLCELVERLNSDTVDRYISMRIFNSRGITVRSHKEKGEQERAIVATFERYKEKTKLMYPRMTKIFNGLIKEYSEEAGRVDVEASIEDLEY